MTSNQHVSTLCADGKHEWCANRSAEESHCQCSCHRTSKKMTYCDIRNRHVGLLRQLLEHTAEDEETALRWAINRLEGLPEHWVAESPSETPAEPAPGLLMSMAIRMDHGLGVPGYYDQPMFGSGSPSHKQRLEAALVTARQMWEEVTGHGFYQPEKEAEYARRAAPSSTP